MKRWKIDPTEFGCAPGISVFRKFMNTVAGTGAVFAGLHVFFCYMSFDKTPSKITGEVPRFLDLAEARYYLVLLLLFLLTGVVSGIFRVFPAFTLLPASATTTYILLLFDADVLTAGPMTFLIFSLFLVVGYTYIAFSARGKWSNLLYRSVWALIGIIASAFAFKVYLTAPNAAESLRDYLIPNQELDGLSAVWRYERLGVLKQTFEQGSQDHYLWVSLCGILLSAFLVVFPRQKVLLAICSIGLVGIFSYLVIFEKLPYYPMFYAVPIMLMAIGCLIHAVSGEVNIRFDKQ